MNAIWHFKNDDLLEIGGLHRSVTKFLAFFSQVGTWIRTSHIRGSIPECCLNGSHLTQAVNHSTHLLHILHVLCLSSHKFTAHRESCNANLALSLNNLARQKTEACRVSVLCTFLERLISAWLWTWPNSWQSCSCSWWDSPSSSLQWTHPSLILLRFIT